MTFSLALTAMLLELAFGYSNRLYERIGHPVTWIGRLITALDHRWNRSSITPAIRRLGGVGALLALVAVSGLVGLVIHDFARSALGFLVVALIASSLIAQRSLYKHVAAVADALETGGLLAGRKAVSQIVGRDPESLDEAGVCRAAIESLAENFSDGVVAPVFWLAIAGLPGAAIYKAVNTADSMIGHKSDRYREFGWAAARFDDLINLPASRLSAVLITTGSRFVDGASPEKAWAAVRSDAKLHRSPNAGWPEAAMAGALGLSLAGPRQYSGVLVEDAEMGRGGRRDADAADIRCALRLYRAADGLLIGLIAAIAIILHV